MKILIIPDLHGSDKWKKYIYGNYEFDHCVFLGDYVDSYDKTNDEILTNLADIISLKQANSSRVTLLLGNHELSYLMMDQGYYCSGFRAEIAFDIADMLKSYRKLFKNAWQEDIYVLTHAGIHEGWFKYRFKGDSKKNIADQLNNPINKEQEEALLDIGYKKGGNRKIGGIFWCDKAELKKPLLNYVQIVGHTRVKKPIAYNRKSGYVNFIDCIEDTDTPFIIDI